MASDVEICNMAYGHLGVTARVTAISPPDGSVEADRCAMFFPTARRALLEATKPSWARTRVALVANEANASAVWSYAYARPSNCVKPLSIPRGAVSSVFSGADPLLYTPDPVMAAIATMDEQLSASFVVEGQVIYAHEPDAVLIYVADVEELGHAPAQWCIGLGYMLASMLAGGTIKGRPGAQAAKTFYDMAVSIAAQAAANEANDSVQQHHVVAPWMVARR